MSNDARTNARIGQLVVELSKLNNDYDEVLTRLHETAVQLHRALEHVEAWSYNKGMTRAKVGGDGTVTTEPLMDGIKVDSSKINQDIARLAAIRKRSAVVVQELGDFGITMTSYANAG